MTKNVKRSIRWTIYLLCSTGLAVGWYFWWPYHMEAVLQDAESTALQAYELGAERKDAEEVMNSKGRADYLRIEREEGALEWVRIKRSYADELLPSCFVELEAKRRGRWRTEEVIVSGGKVCAINYRPK